MGRSGAGKGTQAKLIMDLLKQNDPSRGIIYLQTGQELRQFIQGQTYTEKRTKEIYDKGGLMPEFIAIYVWVRAIVERFKGDEHIVFDGAARRVEEARILAPVFEYYGLPKPWVIYLDIDNGEAVDRLLARKRFDDNEEEIKKRLSWYDTEVTQSIEFFRTSQAFNFLDVDGKRSVEEIHRDIVERTGLR